MVSGLIFLAVLDIKKNQLFGLRTRSKAEKP